MTTIIKRKKTCPRCGETKWLREFYRVETTGARSSYCIECERAYKRELYARNRKKPDRVYKNAETGQLMEHKGNATHIFWSEAMLERLRKDFPHVKNEHLALDLGVSPRTMIRKARELGLQKSEVFMRRHHERGLAMMIRLNRCVRNSGMIKKGERRSPEYEFAKGHYRVQKIKLTKQQ